MKIKNNIFLVFVSVFVFTSFAQAETYLPTYDYGNDYRYDGPTVNQTAFIGGSWSMGGCRDKNATNFAEFATYDSGMCTYKDGTTIDAKSNELIRDENGKPTGDTKTAQAKREAELAMTRTIPDSFTSEAFSGGIIVATEENIELALQTLTCKDNLLENNLSVRTALNSEEVKKLQTFLNVRNGAKLPVTGNYRILTSRAVRDLQRSAMKIGTYRIGIIDAETRALINKLECVARFKEYVASSNI